MRLRLAGGGARGRVGPSAGCDGPAASPPAPAVTASPLDSDGRRGSGDVIVRVRGRPPAEHRAERVGAGMIQVIADDTTLATAPAAAPPRCTSRRASTPASSARCGYYGRVGPRRAPSPRATRVRVEVAAIRSPRLRSSARRVAAGVVSVTVTSVAASDRLLARAVTGATLTHRRSSGARVAGFGAGEADRSTSRSRRRSMTPPPCRCSLRRAPLPPCTRGPSMRTATSTRCRRRRLASRRARARSSPQWRRATTRSKSPPAPPLRAATTCSPPRSPSAATPPSSLEPCRCSSRCLSRSRPT